MTTYEVLPIIPLPYETVPVCGRKLQIAAVQRPDIVAIIANFYNGAFGGRSRENRSLIGCVPCRSPYLSPDGHKLIESPDKNAKEPAIPDPSQIKKEDLFGYGVVAKIQTVEGSKTGEIKVTLDCTSRFKLHKITQEKPYMEGRCQIFKDEVDVWDPALKGSFAHLKELARELFQIIRMSGLVSRGSGMPPMLARQLEVFVARKDISEAGVLADFMGNLTQNSFEDKLRILAAVHIIKRIQLANELLQRQISSLQGSTRIVTIANSSQGPTDPDRLRQLQKEAAARKARGLPSGYSGAPGSRDGQPEDEEPNEIDELKKRLHDAQLSPEAQTVAAREIRRLQKMNPAQAEYGVIRNYLENLAEIPWTKATEDRLDGTTLARARQQLDDDHYGLQKIKKRLLEYLAVLRLKQRANDELDAQIKAISEKDAAAAKASQKSPDSSDTENDMENDDVAEQPSRFNPELQALRNRRLIDKSPILLLVGPPGTGKTSLAKSVATALGRKFHRISLGGVRDEAEIRGHRRTYVAAMPGLIVSGLKKVGVANPVFLLDEIDKVGTSNFHGDPSAAMLEVLDPEQNHTFNDHYVNIPIDLSKVLFIATANTLDTIPPPLLDRMETIQLSGYTTLEKRHIANRHLIPKQITANGLNSGDVDMPDDVVDKIITAYTRESGVRNLEREIGSVCRFKAVEYSDYQDSLVQTKKNVTTAETSSSAPYSSRVTVDDLDTILGIERFEEEIAASSPARPGVVTGLVAFASLGQGSILFIEIAEMPGSGRVQLTGKLGDVLKESVEVALTWVKSHAYELGIAESKEEDIMKNKGIHVHCPAGAIPKDGPSAGLAHTVALVSLFSGKPVPPSIAMTGEVSLRGKVTPVGGIKEKLIGALRAGVKTVLLPEGNKKDVRDLPEEVHNGLEIVFVGHIWEGLARVWPGEGWEGMRRWNEESRL